MQHILFTDSPHKKYVVAVLIKDRAFTKDSLLQHYVTPLVNQAVPKNSIIGLSLKYNEHNKAPAKLIKEHLQTILKAVDKLNITTLLVADASYFKTLTKERKADPHFGYIIPCAIAGYEHISVILTINHQNLFYNPTLQQKLDISINTTISSLHGLPTNPGSNIIQHAEYPTGLYAIASFLNSLHKHKTLTCDIEAFSLNFIDAGIGSIGFAWNQHEGGAFLVDYAPIVRVLDTDFHGLQKTNEPVRKLLLQFFIEYKGTLIYHNGTFDIKLLIYSLFMSNPLDNVGLVKGLKHMYVDIACTKIITYLATNTTAGNVLGLKPNSFEFTGNYAQEDIKDIRIIQKDSLLEYNLIDCLATWFVYNKNYPRMVKDNQDSVYREIFLPSMRIITHMELTGMPTILEQSKQVETELQIIQDTTHLALQNSAIIKEFEWQTQCEDMVKANLLLKKKIRPLSDFKMALKPSSNKQTANLLYSKKHMNLPIIDTTDTGLPATGQKTLQKLLNQLINEFAIQPEELLTNKQET